MNQVSRVPHAMHKLWMSCFATPELEFLGWNPLQFSRNSDELKQTKLQESLALGSNSFDDRLW